MGAKPFSSGNRRAAKDTRRRLSTRDFVSMLGSGPFPDSPLRGVYSRNRVYEIVTGWETFEPALTRAEQMDISDLSRFAAQVPEEWYGYDVDGLNRLIETLCRRRSIIRDLITDFRSSNRNPF